LAQKDAFKKFQELFFFFEPFPFPIPEDRQLAVADRDTVRVPDVAEANDLPKPTSLPLFFYIPLAIKIPASAFF